MNPQEMRWEEEAHYYNTIQYFNALVRQHGAKQVLEDLKHLDLLTFDAIAVEFSCKQGKQKEIAALFKDPRTLEDDDGRC
jgi:hypothetical protein